MFLFGLWPRFVLVFSCFLFRFFRWRNASLAGGFAGRRFGVVVGSLFCFNRFADVKDRASLYRCFYCLLTRKDRAISATSAKLEEKKKLMLMLGPSHSARSAKLEEKKQRMN